MPNLDLALLILGAWLFLAIATAPLVGKFLRGPRSDVNYNLKPLEDRPESEWSEYLQERAERHERAMKRYGRAA